MRLPGACLQTAANIISSCCSGTLRESLYLLRKTALQQCRLLLQRSLRKEAEQDFAVLQN